MQEYAIIVAGGSGSRMKSDIPKQFLNINGIPVLMHTINAFNRYSEALRIIVVLPGGQFKYWEELCGAHQYTTPHELVAGGATRFHSVRNGLNHITEEQCTVAVHDGVRPMISEKIISQSFAQASEHGAVVVSVPLKDSIRAIGQNDSNKAMDRNQFRLVQTPQTFRIDWMRDAFSSDYHESFTDCASVLESRGYPIRLIEGSYENIKITTPEDLRWAEVFLR